jgi:predicted metal-dependent hydrolase
LSRLLAAVSAPERPEPVLSSEEHALFVKGVREFNQGYYFECHDSLEDLWSGLRGPARDFFQGLIQVSVAFYHLSNDNLAGARSMFERARTRFEPYGDRYFGFDVAAQRREIAGRLEAIARGEPSARGAAAKPQWRFAGTLEK